MNILDSKTIDDILDSHFIRQRLKANSREMRTSRVIKGVELSRLRSDIVEEGLGHIIRAIDLSAGVTGILTGANARRQVTMVTDLDFITYLPSNIWDNDTVGEYNRMLNQASARMGMKSDANVRILGEFETRKVEYEQELFELATAHLDMRVIHGGQIITPDVIKAQINKVFKPTYVLSKHELALKDLSYMAPDHFQTRYGVDFDIKLHPGGLRNLQRALWIIAAQEGNEEQKVYDTLRTQHPDVHNALDLMLHVRSWIYFQRMHFNRVKKGENYHPLTREIDKAKLDILTSDDWPALQRQFGSDILERVEDARDAIIHYTRSEITERKVRGIKMGDGIKYALGGLEIDNRHVLPRDRKIINLLLEAQETGQQISPEEFSRLENEAASHMTPTPYFQILLQSEGNMSETLLRLYRLKIQDLVYPHMSKLRNQTYRNGHRLAGIRMDGRAVERERNLEEVLKDPKFIVIDEGIDVQDKAMYHTAIHMALDAKDIPPLVGKSPTKYFSEMAAGYPSIDIQRGGQLVSLPGLQKSAAIAQRLIETHRILFDCAAKDDINNIAELERLKTEIGSVDMLRAIMIYTGAALDYNKKDERGYRKHQWEKTFDLYNKLGNFFTIGDSMERQLLRINRFAQRYDDDIFLVLRNIPETLLSSRYIQPDTSHKLKNRFTDVSDNTVYKGISFSDSDDNQNLDHILSRLSKALGKNEPDLKVIGSELDSPRLYIATPFAYDTLLSIIAGTCYNTGIEINDAELHTFKKTEEAVPELTLLCFDLGYSVRNLEPAQKRASMNELETALRESIVSQNLVKPIDYEAILEHAQPQYHLEKSPATDTYKLRVTATHDVAGFLAAITYKIGNVGVRISSTSVCTHPSGNGSVAQIEDNFILAPKNIGTLKTLLHI